MNRSRRRSIMPLPNPRVRQKGRTRAILVIWNDQIIAEQYAPGFSAESLLLGWSMAKSVLNLAIGRRVQQGAMSLDATSLRPEWLADERRPISVRQLLRMESGLKFDEPYSPFADSIRMLYREPDMAAFAASSERETQSVDPPRYYYSSGTTNILSAVLRDSFASDTDYMEFLWKDFLGQLGIHDAQLEFDASGTWVASSYLYATARDWARFGKLVLDDGVWQGSRLLPEGWIEESTTPTESYHANLETGDPPGASYGMHWWLNRRDSDGKQWMESVPEDAVTAWGHFGQFLTVVPSRRLIVVRLGLSRGAEGWNHDRFMGAVLSSLPP